MTDFRAVIQLFGGAGVECVIVGGLAATIHGSARLTQDVDLVYARTGANIDRLVDALRPTRRTREARRPACPSNGAGPRSSGDSISR